MKKFFIILAMAAASIHLAAQEDGQTCSVTIKSDQFRSNVAHDGFSIYMIDKKTGATWKEGYEYFNHTDTTFFLPAGLYGIELRRYSNGSVIGRDRNFLLKKSEKREDLAYRGVIEVSPGSDNTYYLKSYSENLNFALLSASYNLMSPKMQYGKLASADLFKIGLFSGYTTSLIKAHCIQASQLKSPSTKEHYFTGSILFLNGEYRVGGAIDKSLDACFLFGYSITPELRRWIYMTQNVPAFDHVDEKEMFFGAEISTRIPTANISFRAGYRIERGNLNIFDEKLQKYTVIPFDGSGVIATVTIALGDRNSKGFNIKRVYFK